MVRFHETKGHKKSDAKNKSESTPLTTRSSTAKGRSLISGMAANLFSPFTSNQNTDGSLNNSVGSGSSCSDDGEGTNIDAKKHISIQTDQSEDLEFSNSDPRLPFRSEEIIYELNIPAVIYDQSDNDWPIRAAILFR